MRTDGQTDMTKLIAAFRNFAKAPENKKKNKFQVETKEFREVRSDVVGLYIELVLCVNG